MAFVSTRGSGPVSLRTAVLQGLAPDGGLYVPAHLAPMPPAAVERLRGAPLVEVGTAIATHLAGDDIPEAEWRRLIGEALSFEIPLVPVHDDIQALELFHGPTLAFKDVGARVLARLLGYFTDAGAVSTVLVATSGDTGAAVADAFGGVPGTRVVVLYPDGQVSRVQEAQFATVGGNVQALAVAGTFDDCQRLVKAAFGDAELAARLRLTSANSINIGRLLPQVFYHAHASLALPPGARPVVAVPSGNFGNLAAGLIAWRLGFPLGGFVAATNVNDTIPRFLASGRYEPRPSVPTVANAMDVGNPSNFERIRWLFGQAAEASALGLSAEALAKADELGAMRRVMTASVHDDAAVRAAMADLYARHGYLCDPHGAIAYLGAAASPGRPRIFLATAHAAKFREVVEPAIGAAVPLPPALAAALARPLRSRRIAPRLEDVLTALPA